MVVCSPTADGGLLSERRSTRTCHRSTERSEASAVRDEPTTVRYEPSEMLVCSLIAGGLGSGGQVESCMAELTHLDVAAEGRIADSRLHRSPRTNRLRSDGIQQLDSTRQQQPTTLSAQRYTPEQGGLHACNSCAASMHHLYAPLHVARCTSPDAHRHNLSVLPGMGRPEGTTTTRRQNMGEEL